MIVIVFNAIKVVCFLLALTKKDFSPFVTLGDSIASFLTNPDEFTRNLGALSASDVRASERFSKEIRSRLKSLRSLSTEEQESSSRHADTDRLMNMQKSLPSTQSSWKNKNYRWFRGASKLRWTMTYFA